MTSHGLPWRHQPEGEVRGDGGRRVMKREVTGVEDIVFVKDQERCGGAAGRGHRHHWAEERAGRGGARDVAVVGPRRGPRHDVYTIKLNHFDFFSAVD